jgi:predicted ATPase
MHLKRIVFFPETYPTTEHYPFDLSVFQKTGSLNLSSPVAFFVGENGTGKSTLLEALAVRCGIHIWRGLERGRYEINRYERELYKYITVEWTDGFVPGSFFASEIFRNFAESLDEWAAADPGILQYFGGKSLITQSHGQSLMSFFRSRFQIKGLYFLDEPETALSPKTQLGFLKILEDMSEAGHAQFIIATHSPILLACPGAEIHNFDTIPVTLIDYEETEHYRIYKEFLRDRPEH